MNSLYRAELRPSFNCLQFFLDKFKELRILDFKYYLNLM